MLLLLSHKYHKIYEWNSAYLVCANRQNPIAQTCMLQFKRNHYWNISSSFSCSFSGLLLLVLLLNGRMKNHRWYAGFIMCIIIRSQLNGWVYVLSARVEKILNERDENPPREFAKKFNLLLKLFGCLLKWPKVNTFLLQLLPILWNFQLNFTSASDIITRIFPCSICNLFALKLIVSIGTIS